MEIIDILHDIKRQMRLYMNCVTVATMRKRGLSYPFSFGVDLKTIRQISATYTPDRELAIALWNDPARECKIMSFMLWPPTQCTKSDAHQLACQSTNIELIELSVMHLFQHLSFATQLVEEWIIEENEYVQTAGLLLAARLCTRRNNPLPSDLIDKVSKQAQQTAQSSIYFPRKAAMLVLEKLEEQS